MFSLTSNRHQQLMKSEETIMIKVRVNVRERNWDGDPDLSLLWFIRDEIIDGHENSAAARLSAVACTVIVNKQAVRAASPLFLTWWAKVTTIEGLHPRAITRFRSLGAQEMSRNAAIARPPDHAGRRTADGKPKTLPHQIREAMSGSICRCGCYQRIENAVHLARRGSDQ